ncbi:GGDEF domain-containing protein [Actinoplanes lutulentus]|uniref:Uncharacterized protein n=1 Tax=Actinoplanes lutulentus TaxID=1287878 RepID=A0A327Z350_9ACTN|nr:hypothetical protein [Actinoplanes lutulentus]MBB2943030.1 GGDEF domain-containing protein [Actinoplanes lutulentus]RAK26703.1 hypothetical protein B0I29_12692 [Actinoplanes lutulentus]
MRQVYAHQAVLSPAPASIGALLDGFDVVTRLDGDRLRILFTSPPDQVELIRSRLDAALSGGDWELVSSGCARVDTEDRPDARRLLRAKGAKSE